MKSTRMAIFASGQGTNCQSIMSHFKDKKEVDIVFVLTNNLKAGVIKKAEKEGVKVIVCSTIEAEDSSFILNLCKEYDIDFIVLAGYLRKIPIDLTLAYRNKIINIHPALLPKFGGKGMYGMNVHNAVKLSGERVTGITVHYVTANYDEGKIIAQVSCQITDSDSPGSIQQKVHELEYRHYPLIIENTLLG